MTKIMGAAVAAIAFEEGVVEPEDAVAKWIPEFDAANMSALTRHDPDADHRLEWYSIEPLERNITVWDLLGMSAGFTYGIFVHGDDTRIMDSYPDNLVADKLRPNIKECGDITTSLHGTQDQIFMAPETFIKCRTEHMSQHMQPGANSFYGYDYDVLGMLLGRAYGMDPESLMRRKLWDPLGMKSAMMSQAAEDDRRLRDVLELHFRAPDIDAMEHVKNYTFDGIRGGDWYWTSKIRDAEWKELQASSLGIHLAPFDPITTVDGVYNGVSGYGEGSMMTLSDFGKFLRMLCNKGKTPKGKQVLGPSAWKWMMSATINPDQDMVLSHSGDPWKFAWKFGYTKQQSEIVATDAGAPFDADQMRTATSEYAGEWGGYFGTTYYFDVDTGLYWVGGENTLYGIGQAQLGNDLVKSHGSDWLAKMTAGSAVFDATPYSGSTDDDDDDESGGDSYDDDDDRRRRQSRDDDNDRDDRDGDDRDRDDDDRSGGDDDADGGGRYGGGESVADDRGRSMDVRTVEEIQVELDRFAADNSNHGIQFVGGNAKTNDHVVVSAGCAQKTNADGSGCTPVADDTIFRLASMTKIMGAAVAAIAFEEGVVKPGDSIAEWIPEFGNLSALTRNPPDAAHRIEWWSIEPLARNITIWDLLGMQGGFAYGFATGGSDARKSFYYPDSMVYDALKEHVFECGDFNLGSRNAPAAPQEWIDCWSEHIDQTMQPGTRSLYGYDYDVMGIVLARAYGMNAETLMRTKLWEPLGMDSAMMGQAEEGDRRLARVAELHFQGPPADMEHAADYTPPADGTIPANEWVWASDVSAEAWSEAQNSSLSVRMAPDNPIATADGVYTAVSGYGEGSMMTLEDYSKFLRMLCNKGRTPEGKRVLGPIAWKWMMSPTINPDQGIEFYHNGIIGFNADNNAEWRMGYAKDRGNKVSSAAGAPVTSDDLRIETSKYAGRWGGYYGTAYYFDVESGLYWVGGENTLLGVGQMQHGHALVNARGSAWTASLTSANGVQEGKSRIGANPPDLVAAAAESEAVCAVETDCKGAKATAGVFAALFFILLIAILLKDGHFMTVIGFVSEKMGREGSKMETFANVLVDNEGGVPGTVGVADGSGLRMTPSYETENGIALHDMGDMETSISI